MEVAEQHVCQSFNIDLGKGIVQHANMVSPVHIAVELIYVNKPSEFRAIRKFGEVRVRPNEPPEPW